MLDQIIAGYVEQDKSASDLIGSGLPEDEVRRVIQLIDLNELIADLNITDFNVLDWNLTVDCNCGGD